MSSGNHTHTKHNRQKTTIHVGNGNIALIHITQLTKVASIHLAMFVVIVQSLYQLMYCLSHGSLVPSRCSLPSKGIHWVKSSRFRQI